MAVFSKTAPAGRRYHTLMKITPVLIVDSIERSLDFWVARMGFEKTVDVPEGDVLGFVILVKDGTELMLQTLSSVKKDEPKFARPGYTCLFIEVEDFAETKNRLEGYPIELPERVTFYGMREIGVFEPGGHTVIFAAKTAEAATS
jgi:catechol 2,3-dioxygenase-like lactoylglutathione lyase family enzyme